MNNGAAYAEDTLHGILDALAGVTRSPEEIYQKAVSVVNRAASAGQGEASKLSRAAVASASSVS